MSDHRSDDLTAMENQAKALVAQIEARKSKSGPTSRIETYKMYIEMEHLRQKALLLELELHRKLKQSTTRTKWWTSANGAPKHVKAYNEAIASFRRFQNIQEGVGKNDFLLNLENPEKTFADFIAAAAPKELTAAKKDTAPKEGTAPQEPSAPKEDTAPKLRLATKDTAPIFKAAAPRAAAPFSAAPLSKGTPTQDPPAGKDVFPQILSVLAPLDARKAVVATMRCMEHFSGNSAAAAVASTATSRSAPTSTNLCNLFSDAVVKDMTAFYTLQFSPTAPPPWRPRLRWPAP